MLSSMVKEHQARQQIRREEQERRRKEALMASSNLTNALVNHLNVGVAQAYLNQKRLDAEARRLEQSAAVLHKQTHHWITLVNGFCSALKQVGDVVSWAQVMHTDIAIIAATLQHAYNTTYNTSATATSASVTAAIAGPNTSGGNSLRTSNGNNYNSSRNSGASGSSVIEGGTGVNATTTDTSSGIRKPKTDDAENANASCLSNTNVDGTKNH